jgi:transcriptional regulator with XRE-family HTH domain
MKGTRPLRYQLLDPNESPPPPRRLRYRRGRSRKTQLLHTHVARVGHHLRACRFRSGRNGRGEWSLRSVAQRAEMSHTSLSQVETGKRRVVADDLLHLADVLGEDREELLVRAGYLPASALDNRGKYQLSAAERHLIDLVRARPHLLDPLTTVLSHLR